MRSRSCDVEDAGLYCLVAIFGIVSFMLFDWSLLITITIVTHHLRNSCWDYSSWNEVESFGSTFRLSVLSLASSVGPDHSG
jgi:hypothetical protein